MDNIVSDLKTFEINISDLVLDPANARKHNTKNLRAIKASLESFGQRSPIVVQKKNMVVRAGNGRVEAARELGWTRIAAILVDESDTSATAFAIADNRTSDLAEWDDEALQAQLSALKLEDEELFSASGFTDKELETMERLDDVYTRKIETPIYSPTGNPSLKDLYDDKKTQALLRQIDKSGAPEPLKHFLRVAAGRHTVLNFAKIADFYANQSDEVKGMMEASALVVIDFDKAIENGFVSLTEKWLKLIAKDEKHRS